MKKIIRFSINKLFIVAVSLAGFIVQAELKFVKPLILTGHLANHVKRVEDAQKTQFIAKLHFHPEQAIAEALSTQIGMAIGLNINDVDFIDIGEDIFGEARKNVTLHSIVPGQEVYRQYIDHIVFIRGGLMEDDNFQSLIAFKTLCPIVALDIFTDNYDRHNGNLFFDKASQQFHAIDMDYSFCKITEVPLSFVPVDQRNSMALNAYAFLKKYQRNEKKLSEDEKESLQGIKVALEKMIALYSPKKLYDTWMELASKINKVYTPIEKLRIAFVLNKQYYKTLFLHAQLTVLTNTRSREYRSEGMVWLGDTIMELQSSSQNMHKKLSAKYEILHAQLTQTVERLGLLNVLSKYSVLFNQHIAV